MEKITSQQVIAGIFSGDFDSEFETLYRAIEARRSQIAKENAIELRIGDKVRIERIRPAWLNGQTGVVSGLPRSGRSMRFQITLDNPPHPTDRVQHGVPSACLVKP